jgi:hypothetical protein
VLIRSEEETLLTLKGWDSNSILVPYKMQWSETLIKWLLLANVILYQTFGDKTCRERT